MDIQLEPEQTLLAALGEHLRQWRLVTGLSQELLAERAGVSVPVIRRLEAGEGGVRLGSFAAVATVLRLDARLTEATDPLMTDIGRLRAPRLLRRRAPRSTPR